MLLPSCITLALWGTAVLGKEIAQNQAKAKELYDSGIKHNNLMAKKMQTWSLQRAAGAMNSSQYRALDYVPCVNGLATAVTGDPLNTFRCKNTDLYSFLSHAELGSTGEGSSSWGWTSADGREFVGIGQQDGTAFVEINKQGKMIYLGRLPQYSVTSIWREIRGYKDYLLIGSEAQGHYIQIFDMKKLLSLNPASPKTFSNSQDLTGLFKGLPSGRTHNVVVNEEKNYAVAVGAQPRTSTCKSGLIFIDLTDPSKPTTPGCASQDGYVHDAQCLVYRGPDTKYVGKDICYGYNEDTLTIYDVTNKKETKVISKTSYDGATYTHQGWVLDKQWQAFLLSDDEIDEEEGNGPAADGYPVTYIWNITSLEKPLQTGYYKSSVKSIDHNQYVIDGYTYQSNYGAGLRVLDISSIPTDPTGKSVCEVAFFDVYPEDDKSPGGGIVDFHGTWSSYAFFKSGFIFINTIERGAFVVKVTNKPKCPAKP